MCIVFHVKFTYSYQILIKLEISRKIFEKYSNIKFLNRFFVFFLNVKFQDNPYSGSQVVKCVGRTGRQT
jgi:hypothetical protein